MRVIAGTARSLKLKTPEGMKTRPTTDKVKETLFNILNPCLPDAVFLDLFAGCGGIGIEALSRGAAEAVFVEQNQKAAACILENLEHTHLADRARVMTCDVFRALPMLEGKIRFDLIFMDPPYRMDTEKIVLTWLSGSSLLKTGGTVIVEAALNTDFSYVSGLGYQIQRIKEYHKNKHVFLQAE